MVWTALTIVIVSSCSKDLAEKTANAPALTPANIDL